MIMLFPLLLEIDKAPMIKVPNMSTVAPLMFDVPSKVTVAPTATFIVPPVGLNVSTVPPGTSVASLLKFHVPVDGPIFVSIVNGLFIFTVVALPWFGTAPPDHKLASLQLPLVSVVCARVVPALNRHTTTVKRYNPDLNTLAISIELDC